MKKIPLRNRQSEVVAYALVDDEDYDYLMQWRWSLGKRENGYATRGTNSRGDFAMHREIMGLTRGDGLEVDHKDGCGLNNQRHNLRIVTRQKNAENMRAHRDSRTSHHRGVSFDSRRQCWVARACVRGKIYQRYCVTEVEAAEAAANLRHLHMTHANEARH